VDPGFHDVPAGPAHTNRDADGVACGTLGW
jgi:hypothetical protein